ncbi:MAG: ThiF family adenylyltransferase [bacterium]
MEYSIVILKKDYKTIRRHLLKDRTKEQMVILLCGVSKTNNETRLLAKHIITLPNDAFAYQSSGGLHLKQEIQQHILQLAKKENLSQVDIHTHPGASSHIDFSGIDDFNEKKLVSYLKRKMPGTYFASVVMNEKSIKARVWIDECHEQEIKKIKVGLDNALAISNAEDKQKNNLEMFDRQVRAFGRELQKKLGALKVGVVGVGGFAILTEIITRLGIRNLVIIDNDIIEISNLNRIVAASLEDAKNQTPKVEVAKRNILAIDPKAEVTALQKSVFDKETAEHLKSCDLIIVATDNHSSRLYINKLCNQYLIPLIHLGVNIDVNKRNKITDISGEFVIIEPGQGWCLQCNRIINPQTASWEMASDFEKDNLANRGYIKDIPSPAVYHLNATIASITCSEIHNFVWPYKPLRKYLSYDLLKSELMEIKVKANKKCPVCSSNGALGLGDLSLLPDFNRKPKIPSNIHPAEPVADQSGLGKQKGR